MFPVLYSICRQTSIFKTEMCTLYWYLRSRTTNPWCYWHTKTVETWNCEAEVNPYVLWERLEVTWHSCIPTTAIVQAFSLFPIFEDRSPFLPSVFSPAGNQLALQRQIEALPWGGVLCDWQDMLEQSNTYCNSNHLQILFGYLSNLSHYARSI